MLRLAHLAQVSSRPAARSWVTLVPRRHYAVNSESGPEDPFKAGPSYAQWLRTEGVKYKEPHRPQNWLGNGVPFPLNPSFKPPPPISDAVRDIMWQDFMHDPVTYSPRHLAERFGISIARVDAILRLKGLEKEWIKNKPLQTGFLKGMEFSLGVEQNKKRSFGNGRAAQELGDDAVEADQLSEATKDLARNRYQRLFWEPVADGKDATMSDSLAFAAKRGARAEQGRKAVMLKRLRHLKFETEPDVLLKRVGRPTFRFVDVGVKFVDVNDRLKRVHAAKRRTLLKRRRKTIETSSKSDAAPTVSATS